MKNKNKIIAGILLTGALASAGLGVGCGKNNDTKPLDSTTEVYAFAGATTGMLASDQNVQGAMMTALSANSGIDFETMKKQLDSVIGQTLDKYMEIFDSVSGGDKPVDVKDQESDKTEYKHKLVVKTNTIDGQNNTCVIYFNETLTDGSDVVDTDEEEQKTFLEGELYLNGSETPFYVKGEKEVDAKDGEIEVVFEASLVKGDNDNKVIFKQEHEKDPEDGETEEEYSFEIVVGGKTMSEFSFSLERDEKGKIEVEYEYSNAYDGTKVKFEIEKTSKNTITIETKSFMGIELKLEVSVEKNPDNANQERYVYTLKKFGELPLSGNDVFYGNYR